MKSKTAIILALLLIACGQTNNKDSDNDVVENPYIQELTESQIGESDYYISIPKDYTIRTNDGPDFSVYYFYPSDSTAIAKFSGGLYFGNHPSEFSPPNDSCQTDILKSTLLDEITDWEIYNCDNECFIQTIADSKSDKGWNQYIHSFGNAGSKEDLDKLLSVFSTIKKGQ